MKQWHLLAATLIFSAFALDAFPANAGIQVCNRTQKTVWVALAWDQSPGQWAATNSWGWVKVEPGGCKLGYEKALMTDGSMSYYAVVRDDGGFWRGVTTDAPSGRASPPAQSFCIKPIEDFLFLELHNGKLGCERRDYFRLETGGQANFTITLASK